YLIEQRYGYPVTTLRADLLRGADLSRYNVLIMPSGNYNSVLGDVTKLREWLQQGGTLVALGGASAWLADERIGLLPSKLEKREKAVIPKDAATKDAPKDALKETSATPPPAQTKETGLDKLIEPAEE